MLVFDEAPRPYFIFQMFDDVDGHVTGSATTP